MANLNEVLSNRYELKERLGAGGMATVYRAVDKNLGRDVAIKVLHEHLVHEETFKERFEQEARFIASFNHPNIVQVYDFDTVELASGKVYYMVMPYLVGTTLVDVLMECRKKEETLPHERINQIIADLAAALDYAHARGMVHRDVKPANIIFDENNRAILTDFGIARLAQQSGLTQDGLIIGTPAYMSPEQAMGDTVDYRSDIYALGVILYELLTGRPPFPDDGTVSILLKHAQEIAPPVSQFLAMDSPALDAVLEKVLAKKPSERYQKAEDLQAALAQAIRSESTQQRLKPMPMPHVETKPPATQVLPSPSPLQTHPVTRAIQTIVIRPAKQNPFGVLALIIALVSLLIVARMMQSPNTPTTIIAPTLAPTMESMTADSMTGDIFLFTSDFDADDMTIPQWQQNATGNQRRMIENGQYVLSNSQESIAMTALFNPEYRYENVTITMEAALTADSPDASSGYGIVFRYQDAENYNVFAVDGAGRYSIWTREAGIWRELRNADASWTVDEAINLQGEMNTLTVTIYGDALTGYVNDTQLVMLEESTFNEGGIGIYMATTRNGAARITVDSYATTMALDPNSSMTADSMTSEENSDSMTGESTSELTPEVTEAADS